MTIESQIVITNLGLMYLNTLSHQSVVLDTIKHITQLEDRISELLQTVNDLTNQLDKKNEAVRFDNIDTSKGEEVKQ